ncbi:MAG: hypothetical protein GWM98_01645 [Nitrospinaceae bacterium]|nr:acyloxyacyl hydrolase [Nitrospinaceae bacterium]NIR53448.1 acyloxyacyl hydrolase [Nitrospinaceae bacterium]NIS83851.1 acyloxyacyl hydrolase [Nitrospinaceae bacterium]NIT80642.1 acyloxyacyl hydrolase [Nitrospinaceae bacterium]NIU42970.1 acyloxyacyl hydrolase [Nitrospinaceae bacterium]
MGSGASFDLLSVDSPGDIRTELRFLYLFGNFKYNLTGITGKSFYRGALYWVLEAGTAVTWKDPKNVFGEVAEAPTYVVGFVPVQFEYKFIQPDSKWAPVFFGGVGVTWGEWHKTTRELATAFEFILQSGAGIEYFLDNGSSVSLNYRLWHLSNSNIKSPNIGINAHVFSISVSF